MSSKPRPGRGATLNRDSTRFNLPSRDLDGDWRDQRTEIDGDAPVPRTSVTIEHPKTIISRNSSPDLSFDRSINPYRGCEHGCIYCFARPTHAYHDLSPGLDFETKLFAKPDAGELLKKELSRPSYKVAPIAIGTNTDPYQPIEREWRIMRECVSILSETNHPLMITTKSDRILRDIDLLSVMAEKGLVGVMVSVTSLTPEIAMTLEPRAPAPRKRLAAIQALSAAGIPVIISISPVVPGITDHEIEHLLEAGANAGARHASYIPVRLPHEVSPLFRDWLSTHFPERASKVMATINSMRNGRDNDPDFRTRMRGTGPWADLIHTRFQIACRKNGLNLSKMNPLRCDLFRPPSGDQLTLF